MRPPPYFESVRLHAAQRWDQLEADPELAGPWHQLFKQVQSPRHVLSELLQNADDAGATEATVRIEDGAFVFTHNGEDFTEEHFASLCRFGYSNKRALQTIGFRGVGFKSTFSLGDSVALRTPSLSVRFHRTRFTQPIWVEASLTTDGTTEVRVPLADERRGGEVEKNLQEWVASPVSLLFFRHVRRLRVGEKELEWVSVGHGPIPGTEWMALGSDRDTAFLVARFPEEPLPPEAVDEVRQERMFDLDSDSEDLRCRVELVLGMPGRLYVVLPTGVQTMLPFACNAPFVQDPARLKIKDPEISPTNRWLLERIGCLAASVMVGWIQQPDLSTEERAKAYALYPGIPCGTESLERTCSGAVVAAFDADLKGKKFLLTAGAALVGSGGSVHVPDELFSVWPEGGLTEFMDGLHRPAFSPDVSEADSERLVTRQVLPVLDRDRVFAVLANQSVPRPPSWAGLLRLWSYLAPDAMNNRSPYSYHKKRLHLVPVHGKDGLQTAETTVRLSEKRLLQSEEDWRFLSDNLLVMNQNWTNFLADRRRDARECNDLELGAEVEDAFSLLASLELDKASDVSLVVDKVAAGVFGESMPSMGDHVRLTQIAARLGATVGPAFRLVCCDQQPHAVFDHVVCDLDGTLESLLPEAWRSRHVLHPAYMADFKSCSIQEWNRWITSGRSGLLSFPPIVASERTVWGRDEIQVELRRRGYRGHVHFPYVTSEFKIVDWDFEDELWKHWDNLASTDPEIWGAIGERSLGQPESFWAKRMSADVMQYATTRNTQSIVWAPVLPSWCLKLRDLPCLPDTRNRYQVPRDLMRRTQETEPLMDVEPFLHGRLDTEVTRPLLDALDVRVKPEGPDRLLGYLRALATADTPPMYEVERWYRRLDQMLDACSTEARAQVKRAFAQEDLILTESHGWSKSGQVFVYANEEDVPDAPVIRPSVADLTLWTKVEVAERPTAARAIEWLKTLGSGVALSADQVRRVRALEGRHPLRVWNECGHWLNLAGEWVPVQKLQFSISTHTFVPWSHLHLWARQKTADLQPVSPDIAAAPPFSALAPLATQIEDQFKDPVLLTSPQPKPWLSRVGEELRRMVLDDEIEMARVRALGADLAATAWAVAQAIVIVPYMGGTPAGTPRRSEVLWLNRVLYVTDQPVAKLACLVPEALGRVLGRPAIAAALSYSFGRDPDEITEYMEENFDLVSRSAVTATHPGIAGGEKLIDDGKRANLLATIESEPGDLTQGAPPSLPSEEPEWQDLLEALRQMDDLLAETRIEGPKDEPIEARPEAAQNAESERARADTEGRSPHASIMELFAFSLGFRKDGDGRFIHPDGRWMGRTRGEIYSWQMGTPTGVVVRYFWPKDHCLEDGPLQIDCDVWDLLELSPQTHALVLRSRQGLPIEVLGEVVLAMRERNELTLHQATYRLVYHP
ncbi:MAG: ATPase [Actinobacteria bacterium]|nr:ATPase [Actinomycetota bacterium]